MARVLDPKDIQALSKRRKQKKFSFKGSVIKYFYITLIKQNKTNKKQVKKYSSRTHLHFIALLHEAPEIAVQLWFCSLQIDLETAGNHNCILCI